MGLDSMYRLWIFELSFPKSRIFLLNIKYFENLHKFSEETVHIGFESQMLSNVKYNLNSIWYKKIVSSTKKPKQTYHIKAPDK